MATREPRGVFRMSPTIRKLGLTVHIVASVGWLGSVAAFLALVIIGITSDNELAVRSTYIAMQLMTWFVIVPLSFASPVSGIVQSLGTPWGLFRHYWVLLKLLITIPAPGVLLLHLTPIGRMADRAATMAVGSDLSPVQVQLVAASSAALIVLIAATILATYKPQGMTCWNRL